MNNTTYAVVGLVVIALIAGWFVFGKDKAGTNDMEEMMQGRSSLKALLTVNDPQKCTFADNTDAGDTSGTVYVANGKMRGDFVATTDAGPMNSHMVVVNNTGYIWSDGMQDGFKISLDAMEDAQDTQNQNTAVDLDKEVDYSCENWRADESMFNLPANITFSDMNEMMNSMMNQMNVEMDADADVSGDVNRCAACDQAPEGIAREQCLMALGCS